VSDPTPTNDPVSSAFVDPLQGNDAVDPTSAAAPSDTETSTVPPVAEDPTSPAASADSEDAAGSDTSDDSADVDPTASPTPAAGAGSDDTTATSAAETDAVDPTVSTDPSSETPSVDAEPSPFVSDSGATDTDSVTTESSGSEESAGSPEESEPTPVFDDTVSSTGVDPQADGTTVPADGTTDETEHADEDSSPDATPANSPGEGDPTATGTVVGKDGAGPSETQPQLPIEQSDGTTLEQGPGVPADVSLSPTPTGYTSDDEEEIDDTAVFVDTDNVFGHYADPDDEEDDRPVRSFGTPIDPTFETATTGYTPHFRGTLRNGAIEVQRADWIGPEVLSVDADYVEELVNLLQGLRDQKQD
jgi:hypothetical protein